MRYSDIRFTIQIETKLKSTLNQFSIVYTMCFMCLANNSSDAAQRSTNCVYEFIRKDTHDTGSIITIDTANKRAYTNEYQLSDKLNAETKHFFSTS